MVVEIVRDNGVEIFCLEETKLENPLTLINQEITLRRNFDLILKDERGASGGILIGINKNFYEILDSWAMEFTLTVILKQKANGWIQKITTTYGPNQRDRRGVLWDEIMEISYTNELP